MVYKGFIGPGAREAAKIAGADTCVNFVVEFSESRKQFSLFGRPGLQQFGDVFPVAPAGGLLAGDHRLFAVMGSLLYEVFDEGGGPPTLLGFVGMSNGQAIIILNGSQILVVNGGTAYIATGTAVTTAKEEIARGVVDTNGTNVAWVSGDLFNDILAGDTITINSEDYTDPSVTHLVQTVNTPINLTLQSSAAIQTGVEYVAYRTLGASTGTFLDGYFIISVPNSKTWRWSALNDGKTWDPLDFEQKEGYPDNICRVIAHDRRLWIFGFQTTEIWENSGDPPPASPFSRVSFIPNGCPAPYGVAEVGPNSIMWLSVSDQGGNVVMRADSVQPIRVSTHALEYAISTYTTVNDAEAYSTLFRGHYLFVLTFPSAGETWVYDLTASAQAGEPIWTRYAGFENGNWTRYRGRVHAFVQGWNNGAGRQILGDWENGVLWQESRQFLTDGGDVIKRERAAPLLLQEDQRLTIWRAELLMQNGAIPVGDAIMDLEISFDAGESWGLVHSASAGTLGQYSHRVLWRQLGTGRRVVIRVSDVNAMETCWTDMFLRTDLADA